MKCVALTPLFCSFSFHTLLHYPKLLPFRGAVAIGNVIIKEEKFKWIEGSLTLLETKEIKYAVGQPIVDAYTLESKLDIIGVVNTKQARSCLENYYPDVLRILLDRHILVPYNIPLNDDSYDDLDFINCYNEKGAIDQAFLMFHLEPSEFHKHEGTRKKYMNTKEIYLDIMRANRTISYSSI